MELCELPVSLDELLEEKARNNPDHPFLMGPSGQVTLGQLAERVGQLAQHLVHLGVQPGDRVIVMANTSTLSVALWFAISKVQAVEVPINPAFTGQLLAHLVKTARARLVVADDEWFERFQEIADDLILPPIVSIGNFFAVVRDEGVEGIEADLADIEECRRASDPALVIFTSGTTGPSKGVVMSQRHQVSFGKFFGEIIEMRRDDIAYNFLPFFHIAAKFLTISALIADARMILQPSFSLSRFWEDVRAYQATVCVAVGGLCHLLNSLPSQPDDRDNSLRLIYTIPMPWEFRHEFEDRFNLDLIEAYGGTEFNLPIYARLNEPTPEGSCGRASPHFEVTVRRPDGEVCAIGEAGEICVRPLLPSTTMTGYLGEPEKTLETFADLWIHTGDRAYMDGAGYFFFQDRLKDVIRRRGENVSSFEVERMLCSHPEVAEAAVVPVPSNFGGDDVKAVIVLRSGSRLPPEELLAFATKTMPHFMAPRYIEFRAELPRTPTMKVQKFELRAEGETFNVPGGDGDDLTKPNVSTP